MSELSLSDVSQLKLKITQENFKSCIAALETAFPFLKPFDNTLKCCFAYILPFEHRIQPGQLEAVITHWQGETGEQMGGSFSMPIGSLLAMLGAEKGDGDNSDLERTVDFNPYKGDPEALCKLNISVLVVDDCAYPLLTIDFIAAEATRKQQLMAFAATIETLELELVLTNGEELTVAPGELV